MARPIATSAVPPARVSQAIELPAQAGGGQRVGKDIRGGEAHEGRDQDRHLRQERPGGIEELRREGDEEGDGFRVERGDGSRVAEDVARGDRGRLGRGERPGAAGAAEKLHPEPDEIDGAAPFEQSEECGGGEHQRPEPRERGGHRDEIAEGDARRGRHRHAAALAQRIAQHQEHGRAGDEQERGRCRNEGKPELKIHGARFLSVGGCARMEHPFRAPCKRCDAGDVMKRSWNRDRGRRRPAPRAASRAEGPPG